MKKYNNINLLIILFFSFITSCKKDEYKDYSTLVKSNNTELMLLGVPSSLIVREDTADLIATITLSLSEPQIVDVHVPITQISGNATQLDDYELSSTEIVFPAYSKGPQTFTVKILDDNIVEGDETFTLQLGNELTSNTIFTPKTMDVTITNATDLELNMSFAWAKDYLLHYWDAEGNDTTVNTMNAIDIDIYVFDSLGSAGGNDQGIYDAATGAHPELLTLTAPDQEGVYVIAANLWVNFYRLLGYGALSLPQGPFPITTTFNRKGVLNPIKLVQDDALAFNTNTEDTDNDGGNPFQDLFKVVVKPNMFIIYNIDGSIFKNARHSNIKPIYKYNKHTSLPLIYRNK